jgi:hypothetical protein
VHIAVLPDSGQTARARCTQFEAVPDNYEHYRYLDCDGLQDVQSVRVVVTAAGDEAAIIIRDYYPMFSIVRLPPQIGVAE